VAGIECALWFVIAELAWQLRSFMVGVDSPEEIQRAHFAFLLFAIAGVNAVALGALILARRWSWSWWLSMAVQAGNVVFAAVELITLDVWWLLILAVAAITAGLLYLSRPASRLPKAE
jgi:hypothetical protein